MPFTSSFGLKMNLINGSQRLNLYMVSFCETDRSSLHASVSICCLRVIPDWPTGKTRVVSSGYTPFNLSQTTLASLLFLKRKHLISQELWMHWNMKCNLGNWIRSLPLWPLIAQSHILFRAFPFSYAQL